MLPQRAPRNRVLYALLSGDGSQSELGISGVPLTTLRTYPKNGAES